MKTSTRSIASALFLGIALSGLWATAEAQTLGADASDADIAAAYNPVVANSGRYAVSGNEITYEAYVAKDPDYMSRFGQAGGDGNAQTMTFSIDDRTMTLSFGEGGPMQGATATLRRPGAGE